MDGTNIVDINSKITEEHGSIYVWRTKVLPYYINDTNKISFHVFIYVENKVTRNCELSVFNQFLRDEYYSGSIDSKGSEAVRKPCTHLCMFLNYLFSERTNPIRNLRELTYEDVNAFLNEYSNGNIGQKTGTYKNNDSVKGVKRTIDAFGYWLSRLNCKAAQVVPNFKKKDFSKTIEENLVSFGKTVKRIKYKTPFTVRLNGRVRREKIKKVNNTLFLSLLYTANYYDKMIALAIALQGFAGLREGETMQMCKERITMKKPRGKLFEFTINLWDELMLRDDGRVTGGIKIPRDQCVYYSFLPIVDKLYSEHLQLLRNLGYDSDLYGALFFNERGQAMLVSNYEERFQKVLAKTIKLLSALSNSGNIEAADALSLLGRATMTSHSLRYFFTEFVTQKCKGNPFEIAAWRGDSSIQSALTYLRQYRPARDMILAAQDEFYADCEKYYNEVKEIRNEK